MAESKMLVGDVVSHLSRSRSKLGTVMSMKSLDKQQPRDLVSKKSQPVIAADATPSRKGSNELRIEEDHHASQPNMLDATLKAQMTTSQQKLEDSYPQQYQATSKTTNAQLAHKFGEESKLESTKQLRTRSQMEDEFDGDGRESPKPDSVQDQRNPSQLLEHDSDYRAALVKTAPDDTTNLRAGASPDQAGSLDIGSQEASKIPDSLQEKQSTRRAKGSEPDGRMPLNEDIPVDRKPKKAKKKKRFNAVPVDLSSYVATYSPAGRKQMLANVSMKPQLVGGKSAKMRQSFQGGARRHFGVPSLTAKQLAQMHRTSVDVERRFPQQDRSKGQMIDLQINPDSKHATMANETPADNYGDHGYQEKDESPMIRTVEGSNIGDGLRHAIGDPRLDEDDTVRFEQNGSPVPHSAEPADRQVHYREFERPSRQRQQISRYGNSTDNGGSYDDQMASNSVTGNDRFNSLVTARRIKNENSRMLQSLETRFSILQRNEQRVLNRINEQKSRAERLMEIRDIREKEKKGINRYSMLQNNLLQQQKLENFKAKEGQRLNLSIVHQSMMLNKKLQHLEIRRERSFHEREIRSNRSREQSAKKVRSSSMKKQRVQAQHAKMYALQQQDLQRKNSHVNKVINEFKTTKMQEKVINSLSNIENLMVNKLANTSQKLQVLKSSDKKDVLEFLQREDESSRGRKRSTSKFRNGKVKNVHSIQGVERGFLTQPAMQFIGRSGTVDAIGKVPNASSFHQPGSPTRKRKRSSSKKKGFAYVSILSQRSLATSSVSRSKSVQRTKKLRSSSVTSSPKQKKFEKLRDTNPFTADQSIDSVFEKSTTYKPMMGGMRQSHQQHSTIEKLPKTRIIKVKKKKKRVIRQTMPQERPGPSATHDLQFMPQPGMLPLSQQQQDESARYNPTEDQAADYQDDVATEKTQVNSTALISPHDSQQVQV